MLDTLITGTWHDLLKEEMQLQYFKEIEDDLLGNMLRNDSIAPNIPNIMRAFNTCPYEDVRVVIVGQSPYADANIADGLAFSSQQGIPPSLLNIYKALKNDLGCYIPNHGSLDYWSQQGVFLLNSILTCYPERSNNYPSIGWQAFTDKVISLLNEHERSLVFMLWGKYAHRKIKFIDKDKHMILKHNHPSPIIACNTFTTCDHFSRCNQFLYETTPTVIDWQIPNVEDS